MSLALSGHGSSRAERADSEGPVGGLGSHQDEWRGKELGRGAGVGSGDSVSLHPQSQGQHARSPEWRSPAARVSEGGQGWSRCWVAVELRGHTARAPRCVGRGARLGCRPAGVTGRRGRPLPPGAAVHSQRKVGQPAPSPHRPVPVTLPFALSFSHTGHFLVSRKCEASPPTSRPPPRSPPPTRPGSFLVPTSLPQRACP